MWTEYYSHRMRRYDRRPLLSCPAAMTSGVPVGQVWILTALDPAPAKTQSGSIRRWIHLDSCEASYDQPLLYEKGWGKTVSYVVAAGAWGLVDVTPRYTAK